uniref:Uncharacterized protein n=1 Tax=Anguilla anguilla TaxID=7936 RepID=A0A0E9Q9R8_ANGAN
MYFIGSIVFLSLYDCVLYGPQF